MRKLIALVLVGLLLVSVFFLSPKAANAKVEDIDECYDEYDRCWERAVNGPYGKIKTTLMLTLCDVVLGVCEVANALKK